MSKRSPRPHAARTPTRRVAMLAYPDIQMLDVMGPLEVFSRTSRWLVDNGRRRDDAYSLEILGLKRGPFRASSGLRVYADRRFDEVGRGMDTLLIAGGRGTERYRAHPAILRWLRKHGESRRRCPRSFPPRPLGRVPSSTAKPSPAPLPGANVGIAASVHPQGRTGRARSRQLRAVSPKVRAGLASLRPRRRVLFSGEAERRAPRCF